MTSDGDDTEDADDRKHDRTRRRSRREIDRAIDDLDPADPYHRRWIQASADEPLTDEQARRAVEQAAAADVRELDAEREREQEDADRR